MATKTNRKNAKIKAKKSEEVRPFKLPEEFWTKPNCEYDDGKLKFRPMAKGYSKD